MAAQSASVHPYDDDQLPPLDDDDTAEELYQRSGGGRGGRATKGDVVAMKRQARAREAADRAVYDQGESEGGTPAASSPSSSPSSASNRAFAPRPLPDSISTPAGFLLGIVLATNVLAFIRNGWPGVASWWSAKFLNSPTIGPQAPKPIAAGQAAAPTGPTSGAPAAPSGSIVSPVGPTGPSNPVAAQGSPSPAVMTGQSVIRPSTANRRG